jgi:hypothetical protein
MGLIAVDDPALLHRKYKQIGQKQRDRDGDGDERPLKRGMGSLLFRAVPAAVKN